MSPFGADRWLVPGDASYFRLELPEARPATLRVGSDVSHPFDASGSAATIGKNAVVPVAELDVGWSSVERVVTVTAAPGQPYVLQHFGLGAPWVCGGRYWVLRREGKNWVSSVHSGDPTDSVDATAIVTRWGWPNAKEAHERPFRAQVIALAPRQPWVRRANLLETTNAFLRVERTGKYEILARGVEARFRIEPFFTSLPPNYAPPDMRGSGSVWDLDAGYYVLTAEPVKKGIVDLAVHAAGEGDPFARAGPGGSVRRTAAQFPEFKVRRDHTYTVYLNRQPEVRAGLVLRPLPLACEAARAPAAHRRAPAVLRPRTRGRHDLSPARRRAGALPPADYRAPRHRGPAPHAHRHRLRARGRERRRAELLHRAVSPRGRLPDHGRDAGKFERAPRPHARAHPASGRRRALRGRPGAPRARGRRGGRVPLRDRRGRRLPRALVRRGHDLPLPARGRRRLAGRAAQRDGRFDAPPRARYVPDRLAPGACRHAPGDALRARAPGGEAGGPRPARARARRACRARVDGAGSGAGAGARCVARDRPRADRRPHRAHRRDAGRARAHGR